MKKNMNKTFALFLTLVLVMMGGMAFGQDAYVVIGGNVFGGGNKAVVQGNTSVMINQLNDTIRGDVYGGGALAHVNANMTVSGSDTTYTANDGKTTTVDFRDGVVMGNVYGGGLGKLVPGVDTVAAKVYGKVYVNIGYKDNENHLQGLASFNVSNDKKYGNVYGCNNICGTPLDSVFVNIYHTKHTTGSNNNAYPSSITTMDALKVAPDTYVNYAIKAVYGGGNMASYEPELNSGGTHKCTTVHVYACDENTVQTIYGGGNAADAGTADQPADTRLIIDGGRFHQVFGGGNGYSENGNHNKPYLDDGNQCVQTPVSTTRCPDYNPGANIFGTASTFINGGLYYQVFGGSNQYGNIGMVALTIQKNCENLLIEECFGGGNEAVISSNVETTLLCTTTGTDYHIGDFYGGSNKANIEGNVTLNVYGGRYDNVFGGSKGSNGVPPVSANIIDNPNTTDVEEGNVTLNLYGGTIDNAFGGSDANGNITGKITVNMLAQGECELVVHNIYGGGHDAAYTPIYTLPSGTTERVTPVVNLIHGTVSKKAPSGSNTTYTGGNVFGGGLGSTATVTANPKVIVGSTTLPTGQSMPSSPQVTIDSIVFGGGDAAQVAGSDTVILQQNYSSVGSIFGGGNQAGVGSATVYVLGGNVSTGVYGGCNTSGTVGGDITPNTCNPTSGNCSPALAATTYPGTIAVSIKNNLGTSSNPLAEGIYGGGKGADTETKGDVTVTIGEDSNPTIYADVYGGSALGKVNDAIANPRQLTKVDFKNGTLNGTIYGGGMGDASTAALVNGDVDVSVSSGSITSGVYGGCNANGTVKGNITVDIEGNSTITIGSGTANNPDGTPAIADVYGGGLGAPTRTEGDVTVTLNGASATVWGDIYGGSALGQVNTLNNGETTVHILSGNVRQRTYSNATYGGNVFGGGLGSTGEADKGKVNGVVTVNIGADNSGTLSGSAVVEGSVFGCNNTNESPQKSVTVNMFGGTVNNNVFGGGNLAAYTQGSPTVNIEGGLVKQNVFGGGNEAGVGLANGTTTTYVNVNGGTIGNETASANTYGIYGGCNTSGTVKGDIEVNIKGGTLGTNTAPAYSLKGIYGGGKGSATETEGNVTVTVGDGTTPAIYGDVYGGSALGKVNDANASTAQHTKVDFKNGTLNGAIYGGGMGDNNTSAIVHGDVEVKVSGGSISGNTITGDIKGAVFGGCNVNGNVRGDATVQLTGGTIGTNISHANVYGGGLGATTYVRDSVAVKVETGSTIYGDVYGGSAKGKVNYTYTPNMDSDYESITSGGTISTTVTLSGGSVTGDIYGGGHGIESAEAHVGREVVVNINSGSISTYNEGADGGNVYGCNNAAGAPRDKVTVNINSNVAKNVFGGGNLAAYTAPTGNLAYPKVFVNNGTVGGNVFGGGNGDPNDGSEATAMVTGNPEVTIGDNNTEHCAVVTHDVYGGGNAAKVTGATKVTYNDNHASSHVANLFGGGNAAGVTSTTLVDMTLGKVTEGIYGGCNSKGTVGGDITVNLTGGAVGATGASNRADVYGGGFGGGDNGTFTNGNVTVTLQNTAEVYGDLYGGSAFGSVNGNISTTTVNLLNSEKLHGKVFGGGKGQTVSPAYTATTNGNVEVNIEAANTNGNLKGIYGGANVKGNVVGNIDVNIKANVGGSGANLDTIFGGGLGAATTTEGDITVTVDTLNSSSPAPVLYGDVYGGSALGIVGNSSTQDTIKVDFKNGTLHGKIYGGGMGDSSDSTKVLGAVLVEITDGTIDSCIYGGCNYKGGVAGKVTINVKGGTIGSLANLNLTTPVLANVFGGGFGELTTTLGDVEVNIGEFKYNDDNKEIHSDVPAIYGDVYGGSALGTVNTAGGTNTTIVNIKNGNLVTNEGRENGFPSYRGGNVFGGGLGEAGAANASKGQVNGAVTVNIGTGTLADNNPDITMPTEVHGKASIGGNVYGCNNTNGSPKKGVLVNVFQTHHTATDSATYVIPTAPSTLTYAIQNVFGGGNKANFLENKDAYVRIYTCDNTVQRVFGGGNAAATNSVTTMIQGGRFAEVFGGGNGEVTAANVNGTVTLNIHGGDIGDIFGGSNQNGTIAGGSTIAIDDSGPCGSVDVDEFFCGGKYADFVGDIDATITCAEGMTVKNLYGGCKEADVVPSGTPGTTGYKPGNVHLSVYGGTFQNVYGGSKGSQPPVNADSVQLAAASADIAGNVTLDIYGGTIDTVFGGNNVFGNIFGKIVVNIMDDGSEDGCPLVVHNVYGGGRDAAYTPSAAVASTGSYPEVNIIHGRVSLKPKLNQDGDTIVISGQPVYIGGGKVFGGGYGEPAIVSHNPKVRIGYDASMADYLVGYGIAENLRTATVDSLVFGGGDRAPVAGSTSVTIQKASSSALGLFGGGNMASVGNATVNVLDGIVTAGVYGGCNVSGTVGGTIDSLTFAQGVNSEHKKYLEIDTIHSSFDGTIAVNLNGGTVGVDGTTTDVVFGGGYGHNTSTTGNVGVTLGTAANSGTTVYGNLYGGSALGSVNAGTGNTTTVTLTSATLYGSVFGGGMGSGSVEATKATSLGNATVNINVHDTNLTGIYGGANVNGDVEGNINVNVKANVGSSGTNGNLDVFGGGYGQYTSTGGDVTVNVGYESTSPIIYGDVYGGSSLGQVNASSNNKTIVNFLNGTLNGTVYGGGKGQTSPNPIAAWVNGDVEVAVSDGTILGTLISGSTYGAVFGGCNVNGVVSGNAIVGFTGGTVGSSGTHANVYGGGLGQNTTVQGSVGMNLGSSTIYGDVYGGSAKGKVNYNYNSSTPPYSVNDATGVATTVTLGGASVTGNIYGGGHGLDGESADVGRAVFVNVNSGSVNTYGNEGANGGNVFGCNNENGAPQESVQVNINSDVTKNIYGGGNLAAYSYTTGFYPEVNVNHGTMANVFGGGLGLTAGVTGNPKVTIGDSESSHKAIITGNVYGGGDLAEVTGNTNVIYCDNHSESHVTNIYGGGNEANVSGSTVVSMTAGYVNQEVYGGGALANVGTHTSVTLSGGSVRMAFGGGMGSTTQAALVERNSLLTLAGTTLRGYTINTSGTAVKGGAFGGCNIKGTVKGSATVEITNATGASDNHVNIYGGGLGENTNVQGSVAVNVGANVFGDVYGGSAKGLVNYAYNNDNTPTNPTTGDGITTSVTLTGGTVTGDVYGGGHGLDEQLANVGREVVVSVNGGIVSGYGTGNADGGNVFGCNNLLGAPQNAVTVNISNNVAHNVYGGGNQAAYTYTTDNNPTVNILAGSVGLNVFGGGLGSTAAVTGNPKVVVNKTEGQTLTVTDVFGGGDAAPVTGNTTVRLLAGTIQDGFGGGNVAIITGTTSVSIEGAMARNLYGGGNRADVTSTTTVTVSDGNVNTGVYGGCNTTGTVGGNITVDVTGGQVGTDATNTANIHGGGYGSSTSTDGHVVVNIGAAPVAPSTTPTGSAVIWGDVYGGSADGSVNSDADDHTWVTLYGGTINGSLYGGGLGIDNANCNVNGAVKVTVEGGYVKTTTNTLLTTGSVFGCNNAKGSPKSIVEVEINSTAPSSGSGNSKVYALQGVYGGGNLAAYEPTPPYSSGTPVYPSVTINGCSSSVKDVYGGGNAAPVPNAKVIINGGDISRVFAGGNGESGTPAHIGWNTTDEITSSTPSSLSYGTGIASAEINGGTILQVFGGSNANGVIRVSSSLNVDKSTALGACPMKIGEVYGGGNMAAGKAGTITIGCTGTWTTGHETHNSTTNRIGYELEGIGTVYGGANQANVNNGIDLTIESGIVENVFGGNNTSGSVNDTIRVTINKDSDCAWYVGNVYGGGNLAKYSAPSNKPNYPKVRVLNGTVSEDVFGGGLGNTGDNGKVTGNPQVIVNGSGAAVNGGVYGGGSLAPTQGNPLVTQTLGATAKVFGGGKAASVTGAPTVAINGGTVSTGIYGGCDSQGNVSGNIIVNVTGGTIGSQANLNQTTPVTADVYGGGYGQSTSTSGNVEVNIGALADTHSEFPKIYGDVYGGSALGQVNTGSSDTTTVNILDGTLMTKSTTSGGFTTYTGGNVFGGGLGVDNTTANAEKGKVNGKVVVNIGAGTPHPTTPFIVLPTGLSGNATIGGNVYGCNNSGGSPQDTVTVNVFQTAHTAKDLASYLEDDRTYAIANVFGGGNEADYSPAAGITYVNIYTCNNTIGRLFGGGNAAATPEIITHIQGGRFFQVFGGGNGERGLAYAANVNGDVTLNLHGGNIGENYGGSNQNGAISGNIHSNVLNDGPCESVTFDEFFCGGYAEDVFGDLVTTIDCSEAHYTSLYGGCNQANVYGNIILNLCGGTYTNVFGGSKGVAGTNGISADILKVTQAVHNAHPDLAVGYGGNVTLNLYGGTIENVFGGSNINGNIEGNITVNVIDSLSTSCPLYITNIYGGSNLTDYVPDSVNHVATTDPDRISPIINLVHAKYGISGNVYGGSRGDAAAQTPTKLMTNPLVNIGYDATSMNGYIPATYLSSHPDLLAAPRAIVAGSVFGGGDAAKVVGNTAIFLRNRAKVFGNVYGGGNMGEVTGNTKVIVNGANQ